MTAKQNKNIINVYGPSHSVSNRYSCILIISRNKTLFKSIIDLNYDLKEHKSIVLIEWF